jgi:hypothetical protein
MGAIAPVAASFMMSTAGAQELPPIAGAKDAFKLPAPQTSGGMPVMDALKARHSTREYTDRPLPAQMLSDLLWAAWGINRAEEGLRTAPSTHGKVASLTPRASAMSLKMTGICTPSPTPQ